MVDVSIVIVSWNTRERLKQCLTSIEQLTQKLKYEVIVVDNASADQSQEMVETEFPQFQVIQSRGNLGFSKACNIGIKQAQGRYVLLLNPDAIIQNNAVSNMAKFLDNEPAYGAVTGQLFEESGERWRCFRKPTSPAALFLTSSSLRHIVYRTPWIADRLLLSDKEANKLCTIGDVHGALFMARRDILDKLGGCDEAFFLYLADTDLSYRIWKTGAKLGYTPNAKVMHVGGASAKKVFIPVILNYHLSRFRFFVKHFGAMPGLLLLMLSFLETLALMPFWLVRYCVGVGKDVKAVQQLTVNWRLLKLYGRQLISTITKGTLTNPQSIDGTQRLIGV